MPCCPSNASGYSNSHYGSGEYGLGNPPSQPYTPVVLDYIRYAADSALTVPAQLGLRPYTCTLVYTAWDSRPGLGTPTITTYPLVDGSGYDGYNVVNVRFRQVSKQEIVLSGGLLQDQDVVIGPFAFPYNTNFACGGVDPKTFSDPIVVLGSVTEMYINITGPNLPVSGNNYKKIWDKTDRNVMYRIYLRNTGSL